MKSFYYILILSAVLQSSFVSCKKNENGSPDGSISMEVQVTNAPATISIPDVIELTIPQGAFEGKATIQILKLDATKLPASTDFEMLESFEITSTSGKSFAKDLEIDIKYDPQKGKKESRLNGAAYYNDGLKKWIPFNDVIVDTVENKIHIKSNHLTKLGRLSYTRALGYTDWASSLHFNYYWSEPGVLTNAQYNSPYANLNLGTDPYYIQDITFYLEAAYKAFEKAGLNVPTGKINVYISKLDPGTDGISSFLGNIFISQSIGSSPYASIEEAVPMVCAHELLHYIQDYYYMQLFADYTVKWWLEATAVQADRLVWPSNKKFDALEYGLDLYQNLPNSWDNCNSDPEYYIAGTFLSYLINYRPGNRLQLQDMIVEGGKATNISYMRTILDEQIKLKLGSTGIGQEFANFIKWAIDGKSDIKLSPVSPTPSPVYSNFKNFIFTTKFQKESQNATIPHLSVAFFKGMNKTGEKQEMIARVDSKTEQLLLLAYKMNRSGTSDFIKELNQNDSVIVELSDTQEWMEVVCINKNKDNDGTASISYSFNTQPYISAVIPEKAKVGEEVSIRGSNLGNGTSSSIYINNQAVNLLKYLKSWTGTQIDFTVPDGASSGPVQVVIGQVASNKIDFEILKSAPVIDSLGTFIGTKAFPGYSPWGGYDKWSNKITLFGKNWSADPSKTFVKVNGNEVPITNSGGQGVPAGTLTIDMPPVKGNISVTIESEGLTSEPRNFFVGIPPEVLHKMPVLGFRNTFIVKYNDHQDGNKEKTFAAAFNFYTSYNQIESALWTGNVLTVKGKIDYNNGNIDNHSLILTFSDDGTKVTSAECEIKSLNLDIKFILNDLPVEVVLNGLQLSFRRLSIPAADYTFYSGTMRYTSPQISFPLSGMAEGQASWPNDFYFWFDFRN